MPVLNATWKEKPTSADHDDGANWSGGAVPDWTATFSASNDHALTFSSATASVNEEART